MASFDTTVVTLPSYTANIGQDTIYFSVTAPNDSTQIQLSNNADSTTFIVFPATGTGAPLKQGFEAGGFPPAGWSVTTPVSGYTWVKSAVGSFGQSQYSAMVDEFSPSSSTAGETPSLISPAIDMSHAPSPSYVKFDVAYSVSNAGYDDSLAVLVSTDCGASWNTIYQRGGDDLATAPSANASFTPTSTQWRTDSVNISDLIGHAAVIFKFEVISGWGNTMFLDNIDIADTLGITAISPVSNQLSVHVFPNPFTETLRLQFTLDATQNMDAAVYSVDGKKLIPVLNAEKENAGTHQVEINTQELSNGIYILKVNQQFFKIEKLK